MDKKRCLMTMLETGFGHKAPALAVRDAIEERWPGRFRIDIVDFARESGAVADDRILKDSWDIGLAFPLSARIGYLLVELNHGSNAYLDLFMKDFVGKGIAYIAGYRPDVVFATHALCLYVAVKAREVLGLDMKVIAFVVDPFDGYSWWANAGADAFLVASPQSRDRLLEHGIDGSKIVITGFPIHRRFFERSRPDEHVASELGLLSGRPTLLVTAGGQGIGRVYSFVEAAARLQLPLNIIAVSGKNRRTRKKMDRIAAQTKETKIVSLGYVTNINELMSVSDAVVGKAGASTAMESFFMGKPFLFTEWATYNDRYIVRFALAFHVGWYAPTVFSFIRCLRAFIDGPALADYAANIESLAMSPGTNRVAAWLAALLEGGAVPVEGFPEVGGASPPPG